MVTEAQPPGNNPSTLSCHTNAASIALNAFQRHSMFYTCNYNIRVTHRNGAIKHIFYTNQIHGGIISRLFLYSFLRSMRLLFHLAVKILLQIFLYEDLYCWPYIHLLVVFPPECQQDRTCYATNTIK